MKTLEWDRVLSSSPINKQAALGSSTSNDEPKLRNKDALEWSGPPAYRVPFKSEKAQPQFVDFTGTQKGRLLVLGIMRENKAERQTWVCKCSCGRYVGRKSKSLKNPLNENDCCTECRHVQFLKRHDSPEERAKRKSQGLGY